MKKIIFLITISFVSLTVNAQVDINSIKELTIGSTIPNFKLKNVINYKSSELELKDFAGKALLLDFWGTFCQPCIAQFPKLKEFETKFNNDFKVISITYEDTKKVKEFFEAIKYKKFSFVTATENDSNLDNSFLNTLFPHQYIPHYIWIGKDGSIKAITEQEVLVESNIRALINGDKLSLPYKNDRLAESNTPVNKEGQISNLVNEILDAPIINGAISYSLFSKYDKKLQGSVTFSTDFKKDEVSEVTVTNTTIKRLYSIAYSSPVEFGSKISMVSYAKIFLEINDPELRKKVDFKISGGKPDTSSNLFCYKLNMTSVNRSKLFDKMKSDLAFNFGITGEWQDKKLKCYILQISDSSKLNVTSEDPYLKANMFTIKIVNKPFKEFVFALGNQNAENTLNEYQGLSSNIIVDETNLNRNVNMQLNCSMKDMPALKIELAKYGISLIEGERYIKCLVLKD